MYLWYRPRMSWSHQWSIFFMHGHLQYKFSKSGMQSFISRSEDWHTYPVLLRGLHLPNMTRLLNVILCLSVVWCCGWYGAPVLSLSISVASNLSKNWPDVRYLEIIQLDRTIEKLLNHDASIFKILSSLFLSHISVLNISSWSTHSK